MAGEARRPTLPPSTQRRGIARVIFMMGSPWRGWIIPAI
jgi:hypothetical protein